MSHAQKNTPAHAHHAWDTFNRYGRTAQAAKIATLMSRTSLPIEIDRSNILTFDPVFQLSYTTLFGFHCSYLFLRTGCILPPITAHIFCNIMGVPEIVQELKRFPKRRTGDFFPSFCLLLSAHQRFRDPFCLLSRDYWIYMDSWALDSNQRRILLEG